jgi:hypothetical protein
MLHDAEEVMCDKLVWEPPTVQNRQLPSVAKTGDIYTLQLATWPSRHPHKRYPTSTHETLVLTGIKMRASGTLE